jgi:hypothetical protein
LRDDDPDRYRGKGVPKGRRRIRANQDRPRSAVPSGWPKTTDCFTIKRELGRERARFFASAPKARRIFLVIPKNLRVTNNRIFPRVSDFLQARLAASL